MTKIELHEYICAELTAIYERKNHDYGDSFAQNYAEFGMVYPIIHLKEKLDRLKSICKSGAKVNESIEDTLLDLANYAIMTVVERRVKEKANETNQTRVLLGNR